MALGDPYGTVTELKTRLRIGDTDDDDALTQALAAASGGAELFCDRQFNRAATASARTFPALGASLLLVDDFHTVTGLVIDGTAYSSTVHRLEPRNGIVGGQPGWPYWRVRLATGIWTSDEVEVTAVWGWASVPTGVTEAVLQTAMEIFKMKDAPFGIQGAADLGLIRIRDNMRVTQMLTPYRRHAAAVA